MKTQVRHEIYDENGLVSVETIETSIKTEAQIIAEKEEQLLAIYNELKALKGE